MKCVVIYFSQTGNTEKIAQAIQIGVEETASHCDIVKLQDAKPRHLHEYDLIGLGTPVHHLREPGNVTSFISDMRFVGGKHSFAFSTHCTLFYNLFSRIVPRLKARGLIVIGTGDWYSSAHHPPVRPEPYPTDGHPDEIDLKEAEDFGREMVERSRRISAGETDLIPAVPQRQAPPPLQNDIPRRFKSMVKLHMDKCLYPECRLCMDNCPVYGIDLTVRPPVFANPCINCTFCELICPTGAIDADAWIEAAAQDFRDRIRINSFPRLAEAEAQGRFRRLVPAEQIGWDTPFYKVHNKHPRWIIGKGPQ